MEPVSPSHVPEGERRPIVHVLVDGRTASGLAAAGRLFESLRVGFPNAQIVAVDNASPAPASAEIARLAAGAGCQLERAAVRLPDYAFLSGVILNPAHDGPRALVTGRLIFWASCEGWDITALLAGRLIPAHLEETRICRPRLSPAFWWIRDVAALRERIFRMFRGSRIGFLDPFTPSLICDDVSGVCHRYATGANLYAALQKDTQAFTDVQLECYDDPCGGPEGADVPDGVDNRRLKGLWRHHDEQYLLRAVPVTADLVFGR